MSGAYIPTLFWPFSGLTSLQMLQYELVNGPDMLDYLKQCGGCIPEALARHYFRQLVKAVAFMHSRNYVHRDLKLENIMLDLRQQQLKV